LNPLPHIRALLLLLAVGLLTGLTPGAGRSRTSTALQANSLCAQDERIIFACSLKPTAKLPAKIVSLCSSRDLSKEHGYLQYRFGVPGKIELEFPNSHEATQRQFRYKHYFRFQVDLTEINFAINGYQYQIFDNYNGEEKRAISERGVTVTLPGSSRDQTRVCAGKPKTDFSLLADVLEQDGND
jgi:hypothetical protein